MALFRGQFEWIVFFYYSYDHTEFFGVGFLPKFILFKGLPQTPERDNADYPHPNADTLGLKNAFWLSQAKLGNISSYIEVLLGYSIAWLGFSFFSGLGKSKLPFFLISLPWTNLFFRSH